MCNRIELRGTTSTLVAATTNCNGNDSHHAGSRGAAAALRAADTVTADDFVAKL